MQEELELEDEFVFRHDSAKQVMALTDSFFESVGFYVKSATYASLYNHLNNNSDINIPEKHQHETNLKASFYNIVDKVFEKLESLSRENEALITKVERLKKENGGLKEKNEELCKSINWEKRNSTEAFCEIAERYMKANDKKCQSQREKVSSALKDITSQLELSLPEELQREINNFDDMRTDLYHQTVNNIGGNVTNFGTLTGSIYG